MSCNRHSVGALILTLAVALAGLLLAYGATDIALRRAAAVSENAPVTLGLPAQVWLKHRGPAAT